LSTYNRKENRFPGIGKGAGNDRARPKHTGRLCPYPTMGGQDPLPDAQVAHTTN